MADNSTLPATGEIIASDDVTTMNGSASSGVKVQRVKNTWGADGISRDVSGAFPLPTTTDNRVVTNRGAANSWRTPGAAGTTGQKLFSFINLAGSSILVDVTRVTLQMYQTVIKAVTVAPPIARIYIINAASGGTVQLPGATGAASGTQAENSMRPNIDSSDTPAATTVVELRATADSDGGPNTLLTPTLTGGVVASAIVPRMITAAGFDVPQTITFAGAYDAPLKTLRAGQGIVLQLDYTLATQNPVTDMYMWTLNWTEYTDPA